MKKTIAVLAMLVTGLAWAGGYRFFTENQILTRAVPTSATTGFNTHRVKGMRVSVCAQSGATLSGAGSINAYNQNPSTGLWERNPGLDLAISVTATSCAGAACRCQVFPDIEQVASQGSQYLPAANAVTVSAGTTVDVYVQAWTE